MNDLYPGFETVRLQGAGAELFARVGGAGPPLVLLHGYPQTHMCWHRIAPTLARSYTLFIPDLRGYGRSAAPPSNSSHTPYSKRAMAEDIVAAMQAAGHARFAVVGHDRGARVGYRLALDHPAAVDRLAVLDILPTLEVWERLRWRAAITAYHWQFLAQPPPLPETLILANAAFYADCTLASWTRDKSLTRFDPIALADYRALLQSPESVHAICEDYRAGATIDRELDEADRAAGRTIAAPTLALWGSDYVGKGTASVLDVWRAWAPGVTGAEITAGHFLAEEAPEATLAQLMPFLSGTGSA